MQPVILIIEDDAKRNKGKVLNCRQILEELSGIDADAFNRSVDITVSRLGDDFL